MPPRINELAPRLFIVACPLGIVAGLVATAGMLLAVTAFATARTIIIPFVATFDGFHDGGETNAVSITGSWEAAGALVLALTFLLSFALFRRVRTPDDHHLRA
ncbi:hypothetical protein [Microbacterium sp. NPDC089695]|uniref:hypothetical protein n=1 Tax=Microbacterium sp. NPDC089695 TaxID=3364198 RepID=UPI0037FBB02F